MSFAREYHTATLLTNGNVLVAGGYGNGVNFPSSAELYDPSTGTWSVTGSMRYVCCNHTATLLTNGDVLVAGGLGSDLDAVAGAELYHP